MDGASTEHCPCPTSLLVPFGNQSNCIRGADPRLQGAPLPENPTPNACGCLRSQRAAVMEGCRDGSGWPKRPTAGRERCGRARGRTRRPGVPRDRSRRCVPPPTGAAAPAAGAGPAAAVPSSPVPAAPAPGAGRTAYSLRGVPSGRWQGQAGETERGKAGSGPADSGPLEVTLHGTRTGTKSPRRTEVPWRTRGRAHGASAPRTSRRARGRRRQLPVHPRRSNNV